MKGDLWRRKYEEGNEVQGLVEKQDNLHKQTSFLNLGMDEEGRKRENIAFY